MTPTTPISFAARRTPTPFASARASNDRGLAAFAAALLIAFALSAGAFLPKLEAPAAGAAAPAGAYASAPAADAKRG
ncbi:MAG TPA: hypothetical protein VFK90_17645 [Anaeromyxobacter sp.]|nr:hypothetical protein [Anaeromyxobacter sp.]